MAIKVLHVGQALKKARKKGKLSRREIEESGGKIKNWCLRVEESGDAKLATIVIYCNALGLKSGEFTSSILRETEESL